ncbi:hemin uptake protein HemP [Zoogloea sp.]|uniref:hemin uptake protein HemP n=1 Tax=Zoogloea sp. TaxID=49181 RepID=UPI0037DA724F
MCLTRAALALTWLGLVCLIRIILILLAINVNRTAPPLNAPRPNTQTSPVLGEIEAPIRSRDLFNNRPCVYIEHEGMIYALRATRAGKLILTK